jgi:hypothetical protein
MYCILIYCIVGIKSDVRRENGKSGNPIWTTKIKVTILHKLQLWREDSNTFSKHSSILQFKVMNRKKQ